jgi:hypothetical protein
MSDGSRGAPVDVAPAGWMGRGHCAWLAWLACVGDVAPGGWVRACALCASGRAISASHGSHGSHGAARKEDQAPRISRGEAEAAEWPDDQATDSMRSRSGCLPVLPIQNSSSQRESQNHLGDYTPFPLVRAYAPDLSYVVYSYLPYRQPLHIVYPAYLGIPFVDVYAQGDELVQWLRFKKSYLGGTSEARVALGG